MFLQGLDMVVYDLICEAGHGFEGWFDKPGDVAEQQSRGLLNCPVCGSHAVNKKPTASHVVTRSAVPSRPDDQIHEQEVGQILKKLHEFVDSNFDDVGSNFAEEARKMHYGETEARDIRGTATAEEARDLKEEGIAATPLPPRPLDKSKLN